MKREVGSTVFAFGKHWVLSEVDYGSSVGELWVVVAPDGEKILMMIDSNGKGWFSPSEDALAQMKISE
jgi:hypothetical protein